MEMWPWNFLGNCESKSGKRAIILYRKLSSSTENGWNHVTFWNVGGGLECEVYVLISKIDMFLCGFCVGVCAMC
jgi:hypothetical protein